MILFMFFKLSKKFVFCRFKKMSKIVQKNYTYIITKHSSFRKSKLQLRQLATLSRINKIVHACGTKRVNMYLDIPFVVPDWLCVYDVFMEMNINMI